MGKRQRLDFRKSSPIPLVAIAGLPHPISTDVRNAIEDNLKPSPRVIAPGATIEDGCLYNSAMVSSLLKSVTEFAERQMKADKEVPAPSQVILTYVPSPSDSILLKEFNFFAYPIRLWKLSEYDEYGRQFRHDRKIAIPYAIQTIKSELEEFGRLKRRLSSPSWKEPLFLPPKNFELSKGDAIEGVFLRMTRGELPWDAPFDQIQKRVASHSDLEEHVEKGAFREVMCDVRDLAFPHDPAMHGPAREIPEDSSLEERILLMRSAYRFGVPLPNGYHHDVQHFGRTLKNERFVCSRAGERKLTCTHANVYPNDFIRDGKKKKK